jgi:K+-sensing histidine kinase KdpD
MISHTVILSVLINLLENISQYNVSHSEIVSINKPTGKYQSVYIYNNVSFEGRDRHRMSCDTSDNVCPEL